MRALILFMAQVPSRDAAQDHILTDRGDSFYYTQLKGILTVAGIGAILFGLLVLGAYVTHRWFRKRRKGELTEAPPPDKAPSSGHHRHRRRHRSQHRRETHRNPTLREAGGLPPPRPEGQAPPY